MVTVECYDIGGTKIRAAIIKSQKNKKGFNILSLKEKTSVRKDFSSLLDKIYSISQDMRESRTNKIKINAVSLGFPGPIVGDMLLSSPPLHIHKSVNLRKELEKIFEKDKIFFGNDLNLATKAELVYGAGINTKNFYLLALSTGIGAGIVLEGKVLQTSCGEFGHDILERNKNLANKCSCGKYGCWVAMSSGYGIEESIKKLGIKDIHSFFNSIKKDNQASKKLIEKIKDYNAQGIGNMLNAFPMDKIIVMGSVGLKQFEEVIPLKEHIEKYTINPVPVIEPTTLRENIGILGAYVHSLN